MGVPANDCLRLRYFSSQFDKAFLKKKAGDIIDIWPTWSFESGRKNQPLHDVCSAVINLLHHHSPKGEKEILSFPKQRLQKTFSFKKVLDFASVWCWLIYIYCSHYLSLWSVHKKTVMEQKGYQDSSNCDGSFFLCHCDV